MTATSRKPAAPFWLAVAIVTSVLAYPVLFGPAVWTTARGYVDRKLVERVYGPVLSAGFGGPLQVRRTIAWWGSWGISYGQSASFDIGRGDSCWLSFWGPDDPEYRMGCTLHSMGTDGGGWYEFQPPWEAKQSPRN